VAHQTNTGPDQDRSEDDKGKREVGQCRGTNGDKDCPEDQRQDDSNEQHPLLVDRGHREGAQDDRKDEDVVD